MSSPKGKRRRIRRVPKEPTSITTRMESTRRKIQSIRGHIEQMTGMKATTIINEVNKWMEENKSFLGGAKVMLGRAKSQEGQRRTRRTIYIEMQYDLEKSGIKLTDRQCEELFHAVRSLNTFEESLRRLKNEKSN